MATLLQSAMIVLVGGHMVHIKSRATQAQCRNLLRGSLKNTQNLPKNCKWLAVQNPPAVAVCRLNPHGLNCLMIQILQLLNMGLLNPRITTR